MLHVKSSKRRRFCSIAQTSTRTGWEKYKNIPRNLWDSRFDSGVSINELRLYTSPRMLRTFKRQSLWISREPMSHTATFSKGWCDRCDTYLPNRYLHTLASLHLRSDFDQSTTVTSLGCEVDCRRSWRSCSQRGESLFCRSSLVSTWPQQYEEKITHWEGFTHVSWSSTSTVMIGCAIDSFLRRDIT